jgi:hypothetical protein
LSFSIDGNREEIGKFFSKKNFNNMIGGIKKKVGKIYVT